MINTKTLNSNHHQHATNTNKNNSNKNATMYKLQDNANTFVANAFPLRRFVRSTLDRKNIWLVFIEGSLSKNIVI